MTGVSVIANHVLAKVVDDVKLMTGTDLTTSVIANNDREQNLCMFLSHL